MDPFSLLIYLLIALLLLAIVWYVSGLLGLPEPVRTILLLVLLLVIVLWLVGGRLP